ncbi:MAG TPA: class IV adenylate cyclase [Planctomycetota bacterium]
MPVNIEIKARASNVAAQRRAAEKLSDRAAEVLLQDDTFFNVKSGRLKLREQPGRPGELIFYQRPDQKGPKHCDYSIFRTERGSELKALLTAALGVRGVVKKKRMLYMIGQTRVHFDEVDGLGSFIELEVVMREGQSEAEGRRIADNICAKLEIGEQDLVECAYLDLMYGAGSRRS